MCNSVVASGREYSTPRKLAAIVGGEDGLVWQSHNSFARRPEENDWRDLDLCLCGIDLPKTLDGAGLFWHRGIDPMEYFID